VQVSGQQLLEDGPGAARVIEHDGAGGLVLYPLMAGQHIAAPAGVRRALTITDRHTGSLTAAASIRRAA